MGAVRFGEAGEGALFQFPPHPGDFGAQRLAGTFILNPDTGERPTGHGELALIEDGTADLVSYGRLFLANPDLPRRLAAAGPFNAADPATLYGGDSTGYTDYPALSD
ncbi:putative oxidoreductase [Streptomyces sparsogenes DSM 40356]|uniref:Putative oxidoreductase n=1 Tax=Streptomyces sparsogenes DSM 40356 TaxID=1331668 RepID=A0A1R1S5K3_9ACTN|nr:putative oxidoreductase [Streptomyces sparsogenes DSM 40356]